MGVHIPAKQCPDCNEWMSFMIMDGYICENCKKTYQVGITADLVVLLDDGQKYMDKKNGDN